MTASEHDVTCLQQPAFASDLGEIMPAGGWVVAGTISACGYSHLQSSTPPLSEQSQTWVRVLQLKVGIGLDHNPSSSLDRPVCKPRPQGAANTPPVRRRWVHRSHGTERTCTCVGLAHYTMMLHGDQNTVRMLKFRSLRPSTIVIKDKPSLLRVLHVYERITTTLSYRRHANKISHIVQRCLRFNVPSSRASSAPTDHRATRQ